MGVAVGVIEVVGIGSETVESDWVGMVGGDAVVVEEVAGWVDEDDGIENIFAGIIATEGFRFWREVLD